MQRTSLVVLAIFMGSSQSVQVNRKHHSKFAQGYGRMEKHGETIHMKGPKKMESYSYVQTEEDPATTAPTWTVRGEKTWQQWAGDNAEYEDGQAATANARPPYNSTIQLEDDVDTLAADLPGTARGEKQWQNWAQGHIDALDNQTDKANSRIPYASTLQLSAEDPAWPLRGEKEW